MNYSKDIYVPFPKEKPNRMEGERGVFALLDPVFIL
jgi:hypothetical protein